VYCAETADVYFGCALSPRNKGVRQRVKAAEAFAIPGFWADVDVRGAAHKRDDLPPDRDEARRLLDAAAGLPPSVVVDSGHGLQAWWLLEASWAFATEGERDEAAALAKDWVGLFQKAAKAKGWELDSVGDLARVLRLPGTLNHKLVSAGVDPAPVQVLESSGRRYRIDEFLAALEGDEPPAGPKVFTATAGGVADRARAYVARMPEAVSGQGGHRAAFKVVLVLTRGFDLGAERARPLFDEYNRRCQPPWSDKEVLHKLETADSDGRVPRGWLLDGKAGSHSGETRETGETGAAESADEWQAPLPLTVLPPVASFPVEVFPGVLRRFAVEAAAAVGCPVDYVAAPMLALAGGAVGASRALGVKKNYVQRPLLYLAVVGPPGCGKTPALSLGAAPTHEAQQRAKAVYEKAAEVYEAACVQAKEAGTEKPPRPVMTRVFVEDATVEALAPILNKNHRGVTMIRDELAAWVTSANQYKGGRGSDRQFWLANWAGTPACIDRKGQDGLPVLIPHPFVAVVGGIQPDRLDVLADPQGRDSGAIDRLLFSYPDPRPVPEWTWDEVDPQTLQPWHDAVGRLLALKMEPGAHGLRPFVVGLTPDARPVWESLMNELAGEANAEDFPPHLTGPWAKLRVYAARLALVVHFLRHATGEVVNEHVDAESVRRAAKLVLYFGSHARKVLAAMAPDKRAVAARRVLLCVVRNKLDDFTRTDLYRLMRGTFHQPEDLDAPLALLVSRLYLRCCTPERPEGSRGPNPPRYKVNPQWDRDTSPLITPVTRVSGRGDGEAETSATSETSAGGEGAPPAAGWRLTAGKISTDHGGRR
jgi:hypothetical protein